MYATQNLNICFDNLGNNGKGSNQTVHAVIYYKHFPLFNCWKNDEISNWSKEGKNQWQLNRSDICMKYDYTPSQYYFLTINQMLDFLEKEFCSQYKVELPVIE